MIDNRNWGGRALIKVNLPYRAAAPILEGVERLRAC